MKKKEYRKPAVLMENYTVSDYIAACANKIVFGIDCDLTKIEDQTILWFIYDANGFSGDKCEEDIKDWEDSLNTCYHTPTDSEISVFSS